MSATRRQVHTLTPFAKVRGATITYPPEDVQRAHLKSRRKHSGSQQVKKIRHIKETKMAHDDRRHVGRREVQRTT